MPSVVDNRVFRRVFGLQRDEVTGELRKLHNEELNVLFCSSSCNRPGSVFRISD